MIRGCLFGLSLSVVVVTVAGYLNASQQARETRALQRTVYALRQFTATEFAETRQSAISAGRELNKRIQSQGQQLAETQRQIESSLNLLSSVQSKLRSLQNNMDVELDTYQDGLAAVAVDVDAHAQKLAYLSASLTARFAEVERRVDPLKQEFDHLATSLNSRIDGEQAAREQLTERCRAALQAEGNMLDSYCYALQALAESRKVRAAVEQELAAEAELEANLLNRLAEDAHKELSRLAERSPTAPENAARIAQAPRSNAPRAASAGPQQPVLIDANSGEIPAEAIAD